MHNEDINSIQVLLYLHISAQPASPALHKHNDITNVGLTTKTNGGNNGAIKQS